MLHRVGAKPLPLPEGVVATAVYGGPADCYRYELEWRWSPLPTLMAIMMNPSVAGHLCGDRTALKLYRLAVRWGCGALLIGNAHAYRTTDQARLAEVADPVGPENDARVLAMARRSDLVLVGYGTPKIKSLRATGPRLAKILHQQGVELHALRVSADGTPWHPLFVAENMEPKIWLPF